jgi:SAM-dependent methyltransferase
MDSASRSTEQPLSLEERLLLRLAQPIGAPERGASARYTLENCLDFAHKTIKGFDDLVRGRKVLDYGCGTGFQAVAMFVKCNASEVFGLDVVNEWMPIAREKAQLAGCGGKVTFGTTVPPELAGGFEVVLSLSAFEHYSDPEGELQKMRRQLKPNGVILLSFAEPWYSHSGSHFNGWTRMPFVDRPVPWLNLFFFRSCNADSEVQLSGTTSRIGSRISPAGSIA